MFADKLCNLSDEALLTHYYRTRDFKAFRLIYLRHKDCLFRYCAQMSRKHCNSILESLWANLLEQPPKLGGRLLRNWLFIQAYRLLQSGNFNSTDGDGPDTEALEVLLGTDSKAAPASILHAVQKLSRQERNVFLLHTECGLSLAAVADLERLTLKQCLALFHQSRSNIEYLINGRPRRAWVSRKRLAEQALISENQNQPDVLAPEKNAGATGSTNVDDAVKGIEVAAV